MNDKNIKPDTLAEGSITSVPELIQLQAQIKDMQMEIDILKQIINVLKRTPISIRHFSKIGKRQ